MMSNLEGVVLVLAFLAGAWYFGYVIPEFIILKTYRAIGGKPSGEENTVELKCTIWSVLSSIGMFFGLYLPLSIILFNILLSPIKIDVNFAISMWLVCLSVLFCFVFVLVLFGPQAVFDDWGTKVA